MPINKYTGLPKRHPMLYILTCLIGIATAIYIDDTQAKHLDTPYGVAPRLLQNCEQKWIGTEYHPLPTCTKVWGMLTRETILGESDYFFNSPL